MLSLGLFLYDDEDECIFWNCHILTGKNQKKLVQYVCLCSILFSFLFCWISFTPFLSTYWSTYLSSRLTSASLFNYVSSKLKKQKVNLVPVSITRTQIKQPSKFPASTLFPWLSLSMVLLITILFTENGWYGVLWLVTWSPRTLLVL